MAYTALSPSFPSPRTTTYSTINMTMTLTTTIATWLSLLVFLIAMNYWLCEINDDDKLGTVITGFTIVIITSFRFVLYPRYQASRCHRMLKGCCKKHDQTLSPRNDSKRERNMKSIQPIEINFTRSNFETTATNEDEALTEDENTPGLSADVPVNQRQHGRLVFLDHVKIFLTFMVVSLHVNCSFGGCGPDLWFLIVESPSTSYFHVVTWSFSVVNQAYFMPLFFFISAYLVPPSYQSNSSTDFFAKKMKRLYLPGIVTTFFLVPVTFLWSLYFRGKNLAYLVWPGHAWYLFWLLLLNWIYHCTRQSQCTSQSSPKKQQSSQHVEASPSVQASVHDTATCSRETKNRIRFPKTWQRLVCGCFFCGILSLLLLVLANGAHTFALVPITVGTIPCDIFMFVMGILARNNGWLLTEVPTYVVTQPSQNDNYDQPPVERPPVDIKSQMDISPTTLRCMVVVEMAIMVGILAFFELETIPAIVIFVVAGIYCLDMGLAVLQIFQQYPILNTEQKWTNALSKASYSVYHIHPSVVIAATSFYIYGFNLVVGEFSDDRIHFPTDSNVGTGGEDWLWLGWILVFVVSHAIVWPLAWCLANLPVLRDIL